MERGTLHCYKCSVGRTAGDLGRPGAVRLLHSCSLIKLCFQLFCCGTESRAKIINILGFVPRPGSRHPRTLAWLLGQLDHHNITSAVSSPDQLGSLENVLKDIKDLLHVMYN